MHQTCILTLHTAYGVRYWVRVKVWHEEFTVRVRYNYERFTVPRHQQIEVLRKFVFITILVVHERSRPFIFCLKWTLKLF